MKLCDNDLNISGHWGTERGKYEWDGLFCVLLLNCRFIFLFMLDKSHVQRTLFTSSYITIFLIRFGCT